MITCKNCGTEMDKVYVLEHENNHQQFRCPRCGASTKQRPIEYDDDGNLKTCSNYKKKKK